MRTKAKVTTFYTRGGSIASEQYIINIPWVGRYFQSYSRIVAFIDTEGKVFLDEDYWGFSVTTGKYRNEFLGEDKQTTIGKINSWEYILTSLN